MSSIKTITYTIINRPDDYFKSFLQDEKITVQLPIDEMADFVRNHLQKEEKAGKKVIIHEYY